MQGYILTDLSLREKLILVPMCIVIIWLGLFPQQVINTARSTVANTMHAGNHATIHQKQDQEEVPNTSAFNTERREP